MKELNRVTEQGKKNRKLVEELQKAMRSVETKQLARRRVPMGAGGTDCAANANLAPTSPSVPAMELALVVDKSLLCPQCLTSPLRLKLSVARPL